MSETLVTTSTAITDGVRVDVAARYSAEHSDPRNSEWFFLYTITVTNEGDQTVRLVSRHWTIVDATGDAREVQGPGVVGQTPELEPGEAFEYTSGCPLNTPFGSMTGSYEMLRSDGTRFQAEVALFELRQPMAIH